MKYLFIVLLFFLASCQTSKNKLSPSPFTNHPLSIVQGATDSDETYISVLGTDKLHPLEYFVTEVNDLGKKSNALKKVEVVKTFWSPKKDRVVEHLHVEGLELNRTYKLLAKKDGLIIDERSFQAFNSKKKRPRIGVASCMDDRFDEEATRMWSSYLNKFVDLNFFIGDNVYADYNGLLKVKVDSVEQLWRRYAETLENLYVYHSSILKPTFFMWDDHDYGLNDGGAEYDLKEDSLKVFETFYPRYAVDGFKKTNFGVGSLLEAYGQNFLFLDSRFYRETNDKKGSHLGKKQFEYVKNQLQKSKKPLWMIKGDQFFGDYHPYESYEKLHPEEFKDFVSLLNKAKRPVLFLSGDRHLTEIMKLKSPEFNFNSYEITSSGIHAKVFKDSLKKHPNPRQLVGKSGVYNYTVIEVLSDRKYKVSSFGEKNWSHFSRELSL